MRLTRHNKHNLILCITYGFDKTECIFLIDKSFSMVLSSMSKKILYQQKPINFQKLIVSWYDIYDKINGLRTILCICNAISCITDVLKTFERRLKCFIWFVLRTYEVVIGYLHGCHWSLFCVLTKNFFLTRYL